MSLDWATFQLVTQGARVARIPHIPYPPNINFTEDGILFGQPNLPNGIQVLKIE
jgi:hypothetical protein